MSENGEGVACSGYGGTRGLQLTSIQAPGESSYGGIYRGFQPRKERDFQEWKTPGVDTPASRQYVMLSYSMDRIQARS